MKQDEIARKLNLSKTTVSRAISGKGRVNEETRRKVLELLDGEQKKEPVQVILKERTRTLCVAIPGETFINGNTYFSEVLYGVCESAALSDYDVMVVKSTENDISSITRVVEQKKADGIILTRSLEHDRNLAYLSSLHFPVAVAGHTSYSDVLSVDIDNEKAAEDLTSILIAKGYRDFTCIVEDLNYVVNQNRRNGFLKAIEKNRIPKDRQFIYTGEFYQDLLKVITTNVLRRKTECIICGDNEIAVKVMSWLKNEGYRIPMDVGVASCYNSSTLNVLTPAVTAVDVSARSVGSALGNLMISRIEGRPYQSPIDVDYNILIRKSTARMK